LDYTAIFILACIFIPLERLFPLREGQKMLRRDWVNDLVYLLVNGFVVRAGFTLLAAGLMLGLDAAFGAQPLPIVAEMPLWAQVLAAIVIADIGYYAAHRICHTVPLLWKFHAVHHSIEEMDWLATHRVHPVDQIFTNMFALLPLWFLGFSVEAVMIYQLIYQAHALLLHSNIRIKFGPLKWLVASPEYHHWHHANERDAHNHNYAAQLSIIDLIAGTMFMPRKRRPQVYGLSEPMPQLYHQQLLHPFRAIARSFNRHASSRETVMTAIAPTQRHEDLLGKAAMLLIFGLMSIVQVRSILTLLQVRDEVPLWGLALATQIVGASFLAVILFYTVTRLPPRNSATGITPRVVAITGTFIMSALIVMPAEAVSAPVRMASTTMVILGTAMSVWCLHQLGRSFAIMATSRELKTQGAYSIVRHPLYAAEVLLILGVVVGHGTAFAYVVGLVWLVLQIRRAQYEELVLSATFPEYADYARRVPMLIPGLRLTWLEPRPGATVHGG
jgi:sterol desaturase/sphingolipid hydroxylase (fatty acid hydroxylase superfamily)/protein-S-isoprenylcysteine O-methyltransferase Ste14